MGCGASNDTKNDENTGTNGLNFPKELKGKVFYRNDSEEYASKAYQYATSSEQFFYPNMLRPNAIVYMENDDDIKLVLKYAKEHKLGVAVRSGGHHYTGASSTCGDNIQIDMSGDMTKDINKFPYHSFEYNADARRLRVGVGLSLSEMSKQCRDLRIFFPHGECSHVHVGGHSQTGGYGVIMRPFGLYADFIEGFDIILPDGTKKTVKRDSEDKDDVEMFFAVIGGSPGNLGVVTHVEVRVLRDQDHPNARGSKLVTTYSKDKLKQLLDIVVEQIKNPPPADYCFSVMVLGAQYSKSDDNSSATDNVDRWMRENHPDRYPPDGELKFRIVPVIAITTFFANLQGEGQEYDTSIFAKVKEIAPPVPGWIAKTLDFFRIADEGSLGFDDEKPLEVSYMLDEWTWKNVREFANPFHKRLWMSNLTGEQLESNGWAEWCAQCIEDIEQTTIKSAFNGCKIAAQFMPLGGDNPYNRPDGKTSASWRSSTAFAAMDIFYDDDVEGAPDLALGWAERVQKEGIGANGKFATEDRRLIWAPHGDYDLDSEKQFYYDSDEVYQRILAVKRKVDPDGVLTPNLFCVGAHDQARALEKAAKEQGAREKKEAENSKKNRGVAKKKDEELLQKRNAEIAKRPLMELTPKPKE